MTSIEELEDRTVWDVTVNEGPLTMLGLSIWCFLLFVIYTVIAIESKARWSWLGRRLRGL